MQVINMTKMCLWIFSGFENRTPSFWRKYVESIRFSGRMLIQLWTWVREWSFRSPHPSASNISSSSSSRTALLNTSCPASVHPSNYRFFLPMLTYIISPGSQTKFRCFLGSGTDRLTPQINTMTGRPIQVLLTENPLFGTAKRSLTDGCEPNLAYLL